MRKTALFCLAVLLLAGCVKEKIVTTPCHFDVQVDWVKGTRVQFTVTPDNPNAAYAYGVVSQENDVAMWADEEIMEWQLEWMRNSFDGMMAQGMPVTNFTDMFCYKGERTIKETRLSASTNWWLLVFQINPETRKSIGPLYKQPFQTEDVDWADMDFSIRLDGNRFTIVPSDATRTWFWEYERADRISDVYGTAESFFYRIIDMYDEYDFLDNLLCEGAQRCIFPDDDPSVKEGVKYTLAMAGCDEDGEITSDVYFADFIYEKGFFKFTSDNVTIIDR